MSGPIDPASVTGTSRPTDLIIFEAINYLIKFTWDGKMASVWKEDATEYYHRLMKADPNRGFEQPINWDVIVEAYQSAGWLIVVLPSFITFTKGIP